MKNIILFICLFISSTLYSQDEIIVDCDEVTNGMHQTRANNFAAFAGMEMYTPIDIKASNIQVNDRPYAGLMYAGIKCISNDFNTARRLTTAYYLGVLGESAKQKQVQKGIHDRLNYTDPKGWDNQIRNDLALNIKIDFEQLIAAPTSRLELIGLSEINLGSVSNFGGLGTLFRIGRLTDYFYNESGITNGRRTRRCRQCSDRTNYFSNNLSRNFQLYVFFKTSFRVVMDNSLLEGGWFSHDSSPHTITSDKVKRFYGNAEAGATINYKGFALTFSQLFRTPEFDDAFTTRWGSITLTVRTF